MLRRPDLKLISDEILIDSGQQLPIHDAVYPTFDGFKFWDPAAWTDGHPIERYKQMREQARSAAFKAALAAELRRK